MNPNPIFIVDDDTDDEDILKEVMADLGLKNEIRFFTDAEALIKELKNNPIVPFLIISDINLPRMTGLELRRKILEDARITDKTIPFIFWSTAASKRQIKEAYDVSAHGFFIKGKNYREVKESMEEIIRYWSKSLVPE